MVGVSPPLQPCALTTGVAKNPPPKVKLKKIAALPAKQQELLWNLKEFCFASFTDDTGRSWEITRWKARDSGF